MANTPNNREATQFRSGAEAVKAGRIGGIASGKARREKATFKEIINQILDEPGGQYKGEAITKKQVVVIKAMKYLLEDDKLDAREFAKMFELVRDTIGEKPIDRVDMSVSQESKDKLDQLSALIDE